MGLLGLVVGDGACRARRAAAARTRVETVDGAVVSGLAQRGHAPLAYGTEDEGAHLALRGRHDGTSAVPRLSTRRSVRLAASHAARVVQVSSRW